MNHTARLSVDVGNVVVNLVGDSDMNVDDNSSDQVHVAVAVNVGDYTDADDHIKLNVADHHAPSDRNHWRRREANSSAVARLSKIDRLRHALKGSRAERWCEAMHPDIPRLRSNGTPEDA
jgi:hypothetical protein